MKRNYYALCVLLLLFVISCRKESSFEEPGQAKASLKSEATGDCLPKTVAGTYIAGTAVTDSNFMEVELDVANTGSYNIVTDTVNGYYFKGSGNFAATGSNKIQLKAFGTPLTTGTDIFTVLFDTTFCTVAVPVLPKGAGNSAVFTLQGAGGACMNAALSGDYVKGVALTSANKVDITVNVTQIGKYNITTTTVNGISFSGAGAFATTGTQVITVQATGTPTNTGTSDFSINTGTATCTLSVPVLATVPPASTGDLFPLTANSWWSYITNVSVPTDSFVVANISSKIFNAQTYRLFEAKDKAGPFDTAFYRKSGTDYLEYTNADKYSILAFDNPVVGDILFLKEGLTAGATWNSAEFTGTVSGVTFKLRYAFTCTEANTTATVNGKAFTSVYKITGRAQVSATTPVATPFTDEGTSFTMYFSKGTGLIYEKINSGTQTVGEIFIKNWKVF